MQKSSIYNRFLCIKRYDLHYFSRKNTLYFAFICHLTIIYLLVS